MNSLITLNKISKSFLVNKKITVLKKINYKFKNVELIELAFTHSSLKKRIRLWKAYESKEININEAREKSLILVNDIDIKMKKLVCSLSKDGCR